MRGVVELDDAYRQARDDALEPSPVLAALRLELLVEHRGADRERRLARDRAEQREIALPELVVHRV